MFTVYILQSESSDKFYIGYTSNIEDRLNRHNGNREKSTKHKGPWKIVYMEVFTNRNTAMRREKIIKSYKGGKEFKKLLWQNLNSIT